MSAENIFIKTEKLNIKALLSPNAVTRNLINVRRQIEHLRLQNPYADL